ncbi:hypothetical protein M0R72_16960 [Candidatus Pacearchaeota archaeon]|jgi:hypothetical protein|nr:hypothetical protein [Candidatus Pacearchaeota archaeon]
MTVTQPKMGPMTKEQLGYFVKGFAKKGATVIETNLYQQPTGLIGAFPVDNNLSSETLEVWTKTWSGGEMDQPLDGAPDSSNWKYIRSSKDLTNSYDKQGFFIFDSANTASAANRLGSDGLRDVQNYFAATRTYKLLRELKAKEATGNTHAASDVWGASGTGDAEADIATAIVKIVSTTGIDLENGGYQFGVAYPSEVLDEFNQLDLINQVTQRLSDYLKAAWKVKLYPVTPWADGEGNNFISNRPVVSSDVLLTSALVFVEGPQTMRGGSYAASGAVMSETERVHATGYRTTMKTNIDYLAVPMDGSANGKSKLIYEITSVTT